MPVLEACAREAIQFAGAIEPHGLLLVLSTPDYKVVQVSANTRPYWGVAPEAILGLYLTDIFVPGEADRLTSGNFKEGKRRYIPEVWVNYGPELLDALVHKQQELLIIELEPHSSAEVIPKDFEIYTSLTEALSEFDGLAGLSDLCQRIASHIRQITGFDRVMVYRFLEDESGCVIAEDRRSDLTAFLGLRYPASDIPPQARRLYLLNTLRLKPDVNAQRAAIIPAINPCTGAGLDMSHCILRAMSPVHDEYLRNMGVSSSLSISIVKGERLWGLIVCHHGQPKLVSHRERITCEVLARVFSSSIGAAEDEDERLRADALRDLSQSIGVQLRQHSDVLGTLNGQGEYIVSAMRARGIVFFIGGKLSLLGVTPDTEQVGPLLAWLTANQPTHIFASERLASDYPAAGAFGNDITGILALRIAVDGPDFILWLRPAIIKVIDWAGNPDKPVEATAKGERIGPRRSFELWKQAVGENSEAWDHIDRQFALSIRQIVVEALLLQLNAEALRLNVELSRSNIELDAFAYSASHDLQEPLRTIRAYTQLIVRRSGPDFAPQVREFLSIIDSNASRMGDLITSLLNYSQLGGTERRAPQAVNSEDALRWALMNLQELVRESGATVTYDQLPTVRANYDQMVQVLQNLIGNAIKYSRLDEPPSIHLSAVLQRNEWLFSVRDNGQGFAPQYAETIFGVFKRLHGRDVPGSGIGLATCKRIVELNGGRIWAESEGKDRGATFRFTAPCWSQQ